MSLLIPSPFGWLLNKKSARVVVNILLAFLYWLGITFHPWLFISYIAIFVPKRDVKLQLTNCATFPKDSVPEQVEIWEELANWGPPGNGLQQRRWRWHVCIFDILLYLIDRSNREVVPTVAIWSTWVRTCWTRRTFTGIEKTWRYSTTRLVTTSTSHVGLRQDLHHSIS